MGNTLIDQFFQAIEKWSERANSNQVFFFAVQHSGVLEQVKKRDFPIPDNDLKKALYNYLHFLIEDTYIMPATLVGGLIRSIDIQLTHIIETFDENREETKRFIDFLSDENAYDNYRQWAEAKGKGDAIHATPDDLSEFADFRQRELNNPDRNKAEYQMQLKIWREVTEPILRYENLWSSIEDTLNKRHPDLDPDNNQ
jgi:hypothetical protein